MHSTILLEMIELFSTHCETEEAIARFIGIDYEHHIKVHSKSIIVLKDLLADKEWSCLEVTLTIGDLIHNHISGLDQKDFNGWQDKLRDKCKILDTDSLINEFDKMLEEK